MKTTSAGRLRWSLKVAKERLERTTRHRAADRWLRGASEGDRCSVNVAYRWDEVAKKREAAGEVKLCGHRKKRHKDGYCLDCRKLVRHHDFSGLSLPQRGSWDASARRPFESSGR